VLLHENLAQETANIIRKITAWFDGYNNLGWLGYNATAKTWLSVNEIVVITTI